MCWLLYNLSPECEYSCLDAFRKMPQIASVAAARWWPAVSPYADAQERKYQTIISLLTNVKYKELVDGNNNGKIAEWSLSSETERRWILEIEQWTMVKAKSNDGEYWSCISQSTIESHDKSWKGIMETGNGMTNQWGQRQRDWSFDNNWLDDCVYNMCSITLRCWWAFLLRRRPSDSFVVCTRANEKGGAYCTS